MSVINKINVGGQEYDLNAATVAKTISYDNTSSGLTAANVQTAIDEVADKINTIDLAASKVTFDDTETQLGSDNVQGAITALNSNLTESIAELKLPEYKLNTEEAIGTLDGKTVYRKLYMQEISGSSPVVLDSGVSFSNITPLAIRGVGKTSNGAYSHIGYNTNNCEMLYALVGSSGLTISWNYWSIIWLFVELIYLKD